MKNTKVNSNSPIQSLSTAEIAQVIAGMAGVSPSRSPRAGGR